MLFAISTATAQEVEASRLDSNLARVHEQESEPKDYNAILKNILIHYENDKAWPRWEYANNKQARETLIKVIEELTSKSDKQRTIIIEGAASPIGSDKYNKELAMRRAVILRKLILKFKGGKDLRIHLISVGEDWGTFAQHIDNTYHRANREKVLAIVRTKASNNEKERRLKAIDNGRTWRELVNNYMNTARNAAVIRIVESDPVVTSTSAHRGLVGEVKPVELILPFELPGKVVGSASQSQSATTESVAEPQLRYPIFAFRSNLLVPALNIGVEVPIGTNWSIGADYYYPWVWPKSNNQHCFELLAWGIEARYWFGRNRTLFDRLQGHSLGLYGYMGYYDFEYNYHGYQGEFANIGLDYTYAMAVGKKRSVHFEFSLGVGYIYSQARKYSVIESGAPLISDKITKKIGYFGPTKANISLVVPIFKKVKANDKNRGDE